jgi:hypothetical protein
MTAGLLASFALVTVGAPFSECATDQDARGFAFVFAEGPETGFEVFIKDPGTAWEDNPAASVAALERSENPWVVFQIRNDGMDYALKLSSLHMARPKVSQNPDSGLASYFTEEGVGADGQNNFGLHNIY